MRGLALPRIGRISNRTRSYSRVPDFILAAGKRDRRTSSSSVWWRNRDQQQYSNLANNYLVFNFSLSNDNIDTYRIVTVLTNGAGHLFERKSDELLVEYHIFCHG
jgi:hypothetical protein